MVHSKVGLIKSRIFGTKGMVLWPLSCVKITEP